MSTEQKTNEVKGQCRECDHIFVAFTLPIPFYAIPVTPCPKCHCEQIDILKGQSVSA